MRTILTPLILILSGGTAYGDGHFDGDCVRLLRDGDQIGIIRVDRSHEPTATLIPGMAPDLQLAARGQMSESRCTFLLISDI